MTLAGCNVLVAGGTGLVGTALVRRLVALGASVRATYHARPPVGPQACYRRADFTMVEDCLAATHGMEVAVICAAQTYGAQVMHDSPTSLVLPNLQINAGLLEACRLNRVARVVFISSSTVYQEAFHPIREDELDLNRPPYVLYQGVGWMKRYVEQLARFYHDRFGLRVAIVRPSNLYGPHDKFEEGRSHVLPALIKRAIDHEDPFVVWGTGDTVRDFLYVEDFVDDLLLVLERGCTGEPLNLGSGTALTVREAVHLILDVCDHQTLPRYDATKPDAIPYRMLDTTRANALLGVRPRTPFRTGIEQTVRWYVASRAARAA